MKRLLFVACVIISISVSAQSPFRLKTADVKEIKSFADSIGLTATHPHELIYNDISKDKPQYYIVKYKQSDNKEEMPIVVFYYITQKGANPDLEIKGTTEYVFDRVYGKFLDLFPYWKQHINAKANAEAITSEGSDKLTVSGVIYSLHRLSTFWEITAVDTQRR